MKANKYTVLIQLILSLLAVNIYSDNSMVFSYKVIDANKATTFFRNKGMFNRNFLTGNAGFEWPSGSGKYLRDNSEIVLGAVIGNDTLVSTGEEFSPGFIDNTGNPQGRDDPAYRVYKIIAGDSASEDFRNWPSSQGAYIQSNGKPFLIGTQTLFSSYSDGYLDAHTLSPRPLKTQILETDWAFQGFGPLGNSVFTEYRIINRSNFIWNDFYFGILTDDNNGGAFDDAVCCDSSINIGYTYNETNNDEIYGSAPPAISFNVLSGTEKSTGNLSDSVVIYRPLTSNNRYVKRGFKDLYLNSFNPFMNGNPFINPPVNYREYYNVLRGLKKDGSVWINSSNNSPTNFPCEDFGSGDYRFMISTGPVNVYPGDTQTVIIVQLVSRGSSNLGSITALRSGSSFLKILFENNFNTKSANEPAVNLLPDNYKLYQNYPNPFNPVTKIKFSIPFAVNIKLTIYDINGKEEGTLVNGLQSAGDHEIFFDGSNFASGIYFYQLKVKHLSAVMKMVLQK